jgi:chromosome partitioning protein
MAPNRTLEDFHAGSRDRQSKGGVGKTTLATNLAGYFARHGHAVMLGDTDRQQSSRAWLNLRPASAPPISTWDIDADNIARPPKGTTHVVLDTPAGLHGWRYGDVMKLAHRVVVPLQPSMFDILATQDFLAKLADDKRVRHGEVPVGVIGMRVDVRTAQPSSYSALSKDWACRCSATCAIRRTTSSLPRTA